MTITAEQFNQRSIGRLPGHLGLVVTRSGTDEMRGELAFRPELMAPNGFLHAGSLITLADTLCGYGCVNNLPADAAGFTTVELKSNHLGTARDGTIECVARPLHRGRTTQVWDAAVSHRESGRTLALFRCTQMVLYGRPAA
ncbi:MAG: PaaI family thioesterase [Burkholderiaceae bacterium]|nr:PaaI family thioesterase [Burkholderiaceae bacterium]